MAWRGSAIDVECAWVGDPESPGPAVVFLHEGLGSVAMWKDFPERFCAENDLRGFVFSRHGYGRSTPRPPGDAWPPDFMHEQAHVFLPRLFSAAAIVRPVLFGHSDGGSIALLHAARFDVSAVVVEAPHLFVEDLSIASIERVREDYVEGDLRAGLARYHDDPDSAFFGWNDAWLSPAFRGWNIEADIATISAPVLAIQGLNDAYGTLEQIRAIRRHLPKTRLLEIADCGHSPHRDRPDLVIREAGRFVVESIHV